MSRSAVVANGAAIGYLFLQGLFLFEAVGFSWPQWTLFAAVAVLALAAGLVIGRWWAVLLPLVPSAAAFLPFAPEPYDGPFVEVAALFAIAEGSIVAVGVGVRKRAAKRSA